MNKKNRQSLTPLFALGISTRPFTGFGAPSAGAARRSRAKSVSDLSPLLAVSLAACGGGGGGSSSSASQDPAPTPPSNPPPSNPPPNNPPPFMLPDDVPLALYENHPTNKAVYDAAPQGQSASEIGLPADTADNNLFTLSDDGRIWFKTSPDDEAKTDSDGDGIYIIRLNHPHNEQGFTEIAVTVGDVAIELTPERWAAETTEVEGFGFTYEQVKDILPDNDFVQYILRGFAFAVPSEGPVIITWSLMTPDSVLGDRLTPDTDTQVKIDGYRANLNRAFKEFEDAANLKFIEVADTAETVGHFRVQIADTGQSLSIATIDNFTTTIVLEQDDPRYSTYVHEIGHALGLAHPFATDGHGGFNVVDNRYQDSDRTIMSYGGWTNQGLQPTDIEALQFLYGDENNDALNGLQAALAEIA